MDVLRRRKPGIVTDRPKPATHMLRARRRKASCRRGKAARWQNRDSNWPRGYLTQRDRAALIEHNNIADIDADYGDCSLTCVSHGIACWRGRSTAGPSHYRTCGVYCSVTAWASARAPTEYCSCETIGRIGLLALTGLSSLGARSRRARHSLPASSE